MNKKVKIFVISFIIFMVSISTMVFATEVPTVQNDELPEAEIQDSIMPISADIQNEDNAYKGDIYKSGEKIEITETVLGDVYITADNVIISSDRIEGNVFVFAENVKISGNVSGYVAICADKVNISGTVTGVYILADYINIEETAKITTDVKAFSNNFNLNGIIYRNLAVMAENININDINSETRVYGTINYIGKLKTLENLVAGKITEYKLPEINIQEESEEVFSLIGNVFNTLFTIAIISTGFVIIIISGLLFNKKMQIREINIEGIIKDIVLGLVYYVMIPAVSIVLMLTIIGIPISLLILVIYIILLFFTIPTTSLEISNMILKSKTSNRIAKIALGFVIFLLFEGLKYVSVIGGILRFVAIIYGMRLIYRNIFEKSKEQDVEVIINKI